MEPKRPSLATRGCPQAGCGHAAAQEHTAGRISEEVSGFRHSAVVSTSVWPAGRPEGNLPFPAV